MRGFYMYRCGRYIPGMCLQGSNSAFESENEKSHILSWFEAAVLSNQTCLAARTVWDTVDSHLIEEEGVCVTVF